MNESTIARYQPGGDIYATFVERYGVSDANAIAKAARTGDRFKVNDAINLANFDVAPFDESFGGALAKQSGDIFSAPLESANKAIAATLGSAIKGIFQNPWVLLVTILIVVALFVRIFGIPKFTRQ